MQRPLQDVFLAGIVIISSFPSAVDVCQGESLLLTPRVLFCALLLPPLLLLVSSFSRGMRGLVLPAEDQKCTGSCARASSSGGIILSQRYEGRPYFPSSRCSLPAAQIQLATIAPLSSCASCSSVQRPRVQKSISLMMKTGQELWCTVGLVLTPSFDMCSAKLVVFRLRRQDVRHFLFDRTRPSVASTAAHPPPPPKFTAAPPSANKYRIFSLPKSAAPPPLLHPCPSVIEARRISASCCYAHSRA